MVVAEAATKWPVVVVATIRLLEVVSRAIRPAGPIVGEELLGISSPIAAPKSRMALAPAVMVLATRERIEEPKSKAEAKRLVELAVVEKRDVVVAEVVVLRVMVSNICAPVHVFPIEKSHERAAAPPMTCLVAERESGEEAVRLPLVRAAS